jgi:uncharacterized protein (DUF3820 family)
MAKDYKFKHQQHTTKFINELNSVNTTKPFTPFRISDEVWVVGKYKGKKISETPVSYIQWAIKNMNLTETALSILKNK